MTVGLGLFYAGLVRAKNALNTFMMCIAAIAIAGVTWALVGYSLAFDGTGDLIGGLNHVALQRRDLRAARRHDDPAPRLHGLPGDLLHHHDRAGVGRRRGADAVRGVHDLRGAVVGARLFGDGALGLRRRLADRGRDARLRRRRAGRDGVRLLRAGGRAGGRRAQGLRPAGAAAAQHGLRAARRRDPVVRLVRLQRRQRLLDRQRRRARVHEHAAVPRHARCSPGSRWTSSAAGR